MVGHRFGGSWTERKLQALRAYLIQYQLIFTKSARAKSLKTIYVDAFAGTGERDTGVESWQASLIGYDDDTRGYQEGSVKVALSLENKFHRYIFIDNKPKHADALREILRTEFSALSDRCEIIQGDANEWLRNWCQTQNWTGQRAVVFLDPYGMNVEWSTIEAIAATKAIDLWILFPFAIGANRMMPKDQPPNTIWANKLTMIFGSDEWKSRFYAQKQGADLLGDLPNEVVKVAGMNEILAYFLERLSSIFAKIVERPLILLNSKNAPMYALCFAAGNPIGAPIAVKIASHLTR